MRNKRINKKQLMFIAKNLAQAYKDGIRINEAVELISDNVNNKYYKKNLKEIALNMKEGISLSENFKKADDLYPPFFIGLISIGENTGKLYEVLKGIGLFYEKYINIVESVKSACVYPAFVILSMIIFIVIIVAKINPSFYEIYKSMNIKPSKSCEFLYNVNSYLQENYFITAVSILCWGAAACIGFKILFTRYFNLEYLKKLHFVHNVIEYITVLLFSILCSTGINISYALKYCENSISPQYLNKKLKGINKDIADGKSLTESLESSGLISRYTLSIIRMREESGSVSEGFNEIAENMEEKISKDIKKYLSYIPPAFVIVMAVCIMSFIICFVLPLYDGIQMGVR